MPDSAQVNVKTEPLLELAERCEAATGVSDSNAGPIRALEIEIHDALFGRDTYNCGGDGQRGIPRYARSLDAAMSLVPEGCSWDLHSYLSGDRPQAVVTTWPDALGRDFANFGATPALALTAASLRARAAKQGDTHGE